MDLDSTAKMIHKIPRSMFVSRQNIHIFNQRASQKKLNTEKTPKNVHLFQLKSGENGEGREKNVDINDAMRSIERPI